MGPTFSQARNGTLQDKRTSENRYFRWLRTVKENIRLIKDFVHSWILKVYQINGF